MREVFLITWSLFWMSAAAYCFREFILEKRMWNRWKKSQRKSMATKSARSKEYSFTVEELLIEEAYRKFVVRKELIEPEQKVCLN